jgi:REP element-mobilizing transposase RayT
MPLTGIGDSIENRTPKIKPYCGKLKFYASVQLRKENESYLKREFWVEDAFLSDGCFAYASGEADAQTIKKYTEGQG